MQMDGGRLLTVNTNYVSSSLYKIWDSLIWFHYHLQFFNFALAKVYLIQYFYFEKQEHATQQQKKKEQANKTWEILIPNEHPVEDLWWGVRHQQQEVQS